MRRKIAAATAVVVVAVVIWCSCYNRLRVHGAVQRAIDAVADAGRTPARAFAQHNQNHAVVRTRLWRKHRGEGAALLFFFQCAKFKIT